MSDLTAISTALPGVLILEPAVFGDSRGFFFESFNVEAFERAASIRPNFVQDNHSMSCRGVLRGMHYQVRQPQGKLLRVIKGEIYDVVVDLRPDSPTLGQWLGTTLSEDNKKQLWVPEGFAHGFLVTSDKAEVLYKTTDYYAPEHERSIRWDDPDLAIDWPLEALPPKLSAKDAAAVSLADAELPALM